MEEGEGRGKKQRRRRRSGKTRGTPGPLSLSTMRARWWRRRRRWWISTIAYMSVLVMAAAPHVHRQYGHVRPRWKSLGGVSLSPRGIRRICRFAEKRTGSISPPFRQLQRTAILLLFVSNPTRRHRHLWTALPVLLQTETLRNEDTILRSKC